MGVTEHRSDAAHLLGKLGNISSPTAQLYAQESTCNEKEASETLLEVQTSLYLHVFGH